MLDNDRLDERRRAPSAPLNSPSDSAHAHSRHSFRALYESYRAKVETADVRYNDLKAKYDAIDTQHTKQLRAAIDERDEARAIIKQAVDVLERVTNTALNDVTGKTNASGVEV